jgi:hypothetical protein
MTASWGFQATAGQLDQSSSDRAPAQPVAAFCRASLAVADAGPAIHFRVEDMAVRLEPVDQITTGVEASIRIIRARRGTRLSVGTMAGSRGLC